MSGLLKNIDVIISRAGASSISEVLALKVPAILIPSPYVANNHQVLNARSLSNHNAAIMIEESNLNNSELFSSIDKCLDKQYSKKLKDNMDKLSIMDSSTRIYNIIKDLIK